MKRIAVLFLGILAVFYSVAAEEARGIKINPIKKISEGEMIGKQWLVLVAIDKYKEWPGLKNPVKDAKELKKILTDKYYFDEVVELYNEKATAAGIRNLFVELKERVKPEDSVFFFYAGHGYLDQNSNTGFWAAQDAGKDEAVQEKWIPNSQIRGYISNITVKHFALVSDSCFSGDLLNVMRDKPPVLTNEAVKQAYKRLSRQALTSGGSETVPDESEFIRSLKDVFIYNTKPYLDLYTVYSELKMGVNKTIPLLGNLTGVSNQDGGSYIFFMKDNSEEEESYNKISSIDGCNSYIRLYPNGKFINEIRLKREKYYYDSAADREGCKVYLKEYPNGLYAAEIIDRLTNEDKKESKVEKKETVDKNINKNNFKYFADGGVNFFTVPDYNITVPGFKVDAGVQFGKIVLRGNLCYGSTEKKLNSETATYKLFEAGADVSYMLVSVEKGKIGIEGSAGAGYEDSELSEKDNNGVSLDAFYISGDIKLKYEKIYLKIDNKAGFGKRFWFENGLVIGGEF